MLPPVNIRTTCRLCDSKSLIDLFSLGAIFVSNFADSFKDAYDETKYQKAPLDLVMCHDCTLVQLRHTVQSELLYTGNYWYVSSTTETMRIALARVAVEASNRVRLERGDIVLDIGSNDGTLLRCYPDTLFRVGVEPAKNMMQFYFQNKEGIHCINNLWKADDFLFFSGERKAKVVTALGMLYDLEDPNTFVGDIAEVLHPDGIFIAQLMCLSDMIEMNDLGNVCHEHLEYYSYESIIYLFEKNGLEVFDVERNAVNGRSTRFYCRKARLKHGGAIKHCARVYYMIEEEERKHYTPAIQQDNPNLPRVLLYYKNLWSRMEENLRSLVSFIDHERLCGKTTYVYGACYSEDVMAYTEDGPKFYTNLSVGQRVYTLNPQTRNIELHPIKEVMEYEYTGPMIEFSGKRVSLSVTPNHRMLIDTRNRGNTLLFEEAQKVLGRSFAHLPSGKWQGEDIPTVEISDWTAQEGYGGKARRIPEQFGTHDFLYILGLYLGDGYCCTRDQGFSVNFCVPEKDKAREPLEETLQKMDLSYRRYTTEVQVASKALVTIMQTCGSDCYNKRIPSWAFRYSTDYLEDLLRGLVDSDGWYDGERRRYRTVSKNLAYDVLLLAIKLGLYPSISFHRGGLTTFRNGHISLGRDNYTVNLSTTQPCLKQKTVIPYQGKVWCVSVENQNLLVVRGGRAAFCGNSTKGNTILQVAGISHHDVTGACDKNPAKHGKYTVGTGILIESEETVRARNPDYLLVLPYTFLQEFISREREFLERGGKFIVPLPQFRIIDKSILDEEKT